MELTAPRSIDLNQTVEARLNFVNEFRSALRVAYRSRSLKPIKLATEDVVWVSVRCEYA